MTRPADFKGLDRSLRKQMVIDAAVRIFHRKGYRAATLDDVANELGLTKAALYHYVSSKENLLSLIYLQALENFFAATYRIAEMDMSPPEKLRFFIRHHLQNVVMENLAIFAVFFSEENQLAKKDFKKITEEKRKYNQVLQGIIEEGVSRGCFRPLPPRLQANAIVGMCNWLYQWYKPGKGSSTPDEITETFIDLLEHGYLNPDGPGKRAASTEPAAPPTRAEKRKHLVEELKRETEVLHNMLDQLAGLT